jgi:ribosomal protein L16 Arg81 hydroxylase
MFENAAPVDVAVAPSVEEFAERYVRRERPVIVRGGVSDWRPLYKWTPEYLKAMCGTRRGKIWVSTSGDWLNSDADPEVAFAKAIDDIFVPGNTEQQVQVAQQNLREFVALHEESPPIRYISKKVIAKNIWMGSTGNITKAHYDMHDNINVQLRGRKEIILFPSTQLDELYPRSAWEYMSNFSRVEIAKPDLSRYPRFSQATPLRAILEPGDFIYIPIYWWHQFYTLEASLNVNFWWRARAGQALRRHGLHYWPRLARDGYLHIHIIQTIFGVPPFDR